MQAYSKQACPLITRSDPLSPEMPVNQFSNPLELPQALCAVFTIAIIIIIKKSL
jgi:hypothetical protein